MAHHLEPPPAAPHPTDTPAPAEPAYLARARRILAGDVRTEDYLPVPDSVRAEVKQYLATLPFEATEAGERELLFDWVFQHHHARDVVLARTTERGVLVLAVGLDQIGPVLERFVIDHHTGFVYICPFTD
jgi:hypothetical protein